MLIGTGVSPCFLRNRVAAEEENIWLPYYSPGGIAPKAVMDWHNNLYGLDLSGSGLVSVVASEVMTGYTARVLGGDGITRLRHESATTDIPRLATALFDFSPDAGTYKLKIRPGTVAAADVLLQIGDGTTNERMNIWSNGGTYSFLLTDGGGGQTNITMGATANDTPEIFCAAWEMNNVRAARNGTLGTLDSLASLPTVNSVHFGHAHNTTAQPDGGTELWVYWNERLSDADIDTISTP